MLKRVFIFFINLYQRTLSPDHGPLSRFFPYGFCRYHPTCSEYAKLAISRRGALRGALLGLFRILQCNPWSRGGLDNP